MRYNEQGNDKYEKPGYVSTKDLCEYYSVCQRTVQRWRDEGLPHQIISSRCIRYNFDVVDAWVKKRRMRQEYERNQNKLARINSEFKKEA